MYQQITQTPLWQQFPGLPQPAAGGREGALGTTRWRATRTATGWPWELAAWQQRWCTSFDGNRKRCSTCQAKKE